MGRIAIKGVLDVLSAAQKRISHLFDNYENIQLAFSGGKDSTALFHLINTEAKKRNRKFEQAIPDEYLFKIQETYTSYIKQHNIKTIFIDASNADFISNDAHVQVVLDALEKDLPQGQHYFNLP